ncbi:MAG TPA: hypothetical protein VHD76_15550 [Bryobacteraceae bacterium]|nr:hypothetical protein [Bryobacteraceae bacterium]
MEPEAQAFELFRHTTREKLAGIRCPYHRKAPRLEFHGSSLRDATISMAGCCDALMDLANRAICTPPPQNGERDLPAECDPVTLSA